MLVGDEGANWLMGGKGRDFVSGGAGDDTLDAGSDESGGWQELRGGTGNDTYRIGRTHGQVWIGPGAEGAGTGVADRVVFTDLALPEVEFMYYDPAEWGALDSAEGLVLAARWTKDGASGEVRIAEMGRNIEWFEFADGTRLSRADADSLAALMMEHLGGRHERALVGMAGHEFITTGSEDDFRYAGRGVERRYGGSGPDLLAAGPGDDWLYGGGGDDALHGGEGNDTYEFSGRAFGRDRVIDMGGEDVVAFADGVSWDELWFSRSGNDLLIELLGTESEVTVEGWWSGPLASDPDASRHVETIVAGDHSLAAGAVQQLVQAMAGMGGPASGQTSLTAVQREQMASPLAAWHELTGS